MNKLLILGATGYTGSMVTRHAKANGLDFSIAGRDADKLQTLAREMNVPRIAVNGHAPSWRSQVSTVPLRAR